MLHGKMHIQLLVRERNLDLSGARGRCASFGFGISGHFECVGSEIAPARENLANFQRKQSESFYCGVWSLISIFRGAGKKISCIHLPDICNALLSYSTQFLCTYCAGRSLDDAANRATGCCKQLFFDPV